MTFLSAGEAARLARRSRELARDRAITPHQFLLFDVLLWGCRSGGQDECLASFTELQARSGLARQTVADGVARLIEVGLIARTKRRVLVRWALGTASRQAVNLYRFLRPRTESAPQTVHRGSSSKTPAPAKIAPAIGSAELEAALQALREAGQRVAWRGAG